MLEKTLESPLDSKEIQPIHPKGNQSWIFIGKTDANAETPILWLPDENWLTGKDPDAGEDWRQRRRGQQRMRRLDCISNLMDMSFSNSRHWWWTGKPGMLQSMGSQRVGHAEQLNWTNDQDHGLLQCFGGWDPVLPVQGPELIPWLRNYMLQQKIPHTTANIQHSQINN